MRNSGSWRGLSAGFPWPPQDIPVTICGTPPGGGDEPGAIIDYPPSVVTHSDLVNGEAGFSWSPTNGAQTFDLQYRSKEIWEATYPPTFTALLTNSPAQQFTHSVGCAQNARDWQFRLRGHKGGDTGDWIYVQSQFRVYPLPWFPHSRVGAVVAVNDPGPWLRSVSVLNLGGGSFNWSVSDNQSWIALSPISGQGQSSFGVTINRPVPPPGGVGSYQGQLTLNISNHQPASTCGNSTFIAAVPLTICQGECPKLYLPVISKN